jgi:hypothetical protein
MNCTDNGRDLRRSEQRSRQTKASQGKDVNWCRLLAVCTENLNTGVAMMKSAQDGA